MEAWSCYRRTGAGLIGSGDRPRLIRDNLQYRGPGCDVLFHLHRIDLVERIIGRVVQIEIAGAILIEVDHRQLLCGDNRAHVRSASGLVSLPR